jgi:GTP pyrophosphokinase
MVTVASHFHDIDSWIEAHRGMFSADIIDKFYAAIRFVEPYYKGHVFNVTNVDLLMHVLTCAHTVSQLHLYADAVIATILSHVPELRSDWLLLMRDKFDEKVLELVRGVDKVAVIRQLSETSAANDGDKQHQSESIRKMLLAMASDIRIVLIVLVERGELMLHLDDIQDVETKRKVSIETVEIFSPLANRLGVWQIKWELEDLSFKYLHPEQYKKIAALLDEKREERLEYIEQLKRALSLQIQQSGIENYAISGRAKHIYSIWRKMKKKNYDFEDLYDIHAIRVLVAEIKDCYVVLGIIHNNYSPIPGEFDDYISNPKSNNYQSLHTCVVGPDNKIVEIQIRTFAMHDHAEYGVAAHWRYKELLDNRNQEHSSFAEKLAWLRQLLDWREELTSREDIANIFKNEVFSDTIYTITPLGRVVALPQGSTPVDFAYAIHSDIGHRCRGAKVDGNIVPLNTTLHNGQRIEILTAKDGSPSVSWLHNGSATTSRAINRIRKYIRSQNEGIFYTTGCDILHKELSKFANNKLSVESLVSAAGYTSERLLCIDIGRRDISVDKIRSTISTLIATNSLEASKITVSAVKENKSNNSACVVVDDIASVATHLAKCCKPLPNDEISGFVTHGKGIRSHTAKLKSFVVDLKVIAYDRSDLLKDVTEFFSKDKVHVMGLSMSCQHNCLSILFTIRMQGDIEFTGLFNGLSSINGVKEVLRI